MSDFNLKFKVDFPGHVKNVIINILFFTVYFLKSVLLYHYYFTLTVVRKLPFRAC